ncbi:glycoside hydrolase family 130 protein [Acuticoccus sp. M5D2P5]|uniref:glycoside hydrolase family 130 protein n=1 Tax=Acuticoccus kalidii TaxID=2910977 RepID=UPI001F1B2907|nr:glycoside hydrolase family 130 protein [Acuticoccus kalidii]MCF3934136.1 glycoside hydrolase family 130 protein [Acuticoccus kalidii]
MSIVHQQDLFLHPDPDRVVLRAFRPTVEPRELNALDQGRANHIVARVCGLSKAETATLLADTMTVFGGRHRNLLGVFDARAREMESVFTLHAPFTEAQRSLIGAYFVQENTFEAAALFNPSIVPHPDQSGVATGSLRFVLSLRAVGEGHVSSIVFRSGVIDQDGAVTLDPPSPFASMPMIRERIGDTFEIGFDRESDIGERILYPITHAQSNGIEDARFVRLEEGDGPVYYATYTAYNGRSIRSELLETRDFLSFRMTPLQGRSAGNKGMALFPRKIAGRYAMIARQDNENLYLVTSDDLYNWDDGVPMMEPKYAWEFVQIGNCGAPIELDEGWLLFTHGVGVVRSYAIGAVLLDKTDPSKVIGRTCQPLISPVAPRRGGYVPNVVYTCGALRHRELIVMPYAVLDTSCAFATMRIDELLAVLDEGIG